jgi:sulfur carrier protein
MPGAAAMITIQLNGEPYSVEAEIAVAALIERLKLRPNRVAVEINREVVPKADFATARIADGDQVEVINFVGGG